MKQIKLPMRPLSVNAAYRGGRRFKSKQYVQFEKDVRKLIPAEKKPMLGDLSVTIEAYLKNDKSSDIDNCSKVVCDVLTKLGYWKDDKQIQEIHLYKYSSKNERTVITITNV